MTRYMKRGGQVWIRIFPDKPVTKASPETPMGSGKGALDHFVAVVRPGRILFEIGGIDDATALEALRLGAHKLSLETRLIRKGKE
jgi:large subunit ribosomal protein L16